jgi:hypothetical protein
MNQFIIDNNKTHLAIMVLITLSIAVVIIQLISANISYGQAGHVNSKLETFSAKGPISSLIFNNMGKGSPNNSSIHNIQHTVNNTNNNPYVLAGSWGLDVANRKIASFVISFTMVLANGTDRHTHEFTNFKPVSVLPILLDQKGITFIGMMDIKINSADKWFGVPISVAIGKNFNTISITPSPKYTNNHFMGQSIYGVSTSLKDQRGTELIS